MPDVFLLHHRIARKPARRLAEAMGIPYGPVAPDRRLDILIRYGNADRVRYAPRICTVNSRDAILCNSNKFRALEIIRDAGVRVPPFGQSPAGLEYPIVGRQFSHFGGRDIVFYDCAEELAARPSDFYVQFVPKQREYRVYVAFGKIVKYNKKVYTEGRMQFRDPRIWNGRNGYRFVRTPYRQRFERAVTTVRALGLDFGAVDMILGNDNAMYILEVNTAPGNKSSLTVSTYATVLTQFINEQSV